MTYKEILKNIKNLKIQGAQNIAIKGIEAFGMKLKETNDEKKLKKYIAEIIDTRATEPAMRNGLNYCFANRDKKNISQEAINHFKESKKKIAEIGAKKIHNKMKVFTHCHSSTVVAILLEAKKQGKTFEVYNTETRPKFQGRITAEKLAKKGIPVLHMVDSAGRSMIRECDLFLFGCDAISVEGFLINKIGTESLVDAANEVGIPSYSCTSSWKFDTETVFGQNTEIEQRDPKEVWDKPPKKVKIYNPAFEITLPDKFTGVITELGVFKAEALVLAVQKKYPYLFDR
jgi:ribose 1,5-bisphosphate isomerase